MGQRTLRNPGIHTAIIMDGNGRWARVRGLPRSAGHRRGATVVRAVVEAAAEPSLGIDMLTLYAFSADNWGRPREEVKGLLKVLAAYLRTETVRCVENDIRLVVLGRRDRLPADLVEQIEVAEAATAAAGGLALRLAIDYSARAAIARAAAAAARELGRGGDLDGWLDAARFARLLGAVEGQDGEAPDVDLLIRTGGEQRLSDFLLWECAYAEFHFTPVLWPDFTAADLSAAVADFRRRDRRWGRVLEEAV
jgi:undecaprenyl diphosphate synthase